MCIVELKCCPSRDKARPLDLTYFLKFLLVWGLTLPSRNCPFVKFFGENHPSGPAKIKRYNKIYTNVISIYFVGESLVLSDATLPSVFAFYIARVTRVSKAIIVLKWYSFVFWTWRHSLPPINARKPVGIGPSSGETMRELLIMRFTVFGEFVIVW